MIAMSELEIVAALVAFVTTTVCGFLIKACKKIYDDLQACQAGKEVLLREVLKTLSALEIFNVQEEE